MTASDFRRIALALRDVVEGEHMGHPDFRVNGRIFATLWADNEHGMVKLPTDEQVRFVDANPATFALASGAWGRQGLTVVQLAPVDAETVGEALTLAWHHALSQAPTKRAVAPRRRAQVRRSAESQARPRQRRDEIRKRRK